MKRHWLGIACVLAFAASAAYAQDPTPAQGDAVLKDFHFHPGQTLPELRIHYRTLGTPQLDAQGVVRNAVLIMHGTTGSGAQFIRREFAGELFGIDGILILASVAVATLGLVAGIALFGFFRARGLRATADRIAGAPPRER
jgi:hypothetical protein